MTTYKDNEKPKDTQINVRCSFKMRQWIISQANKYKMKPARFVREMLGHAQDNKIKL